MAISTSPARADNSTPLDRHPAPTLIGVSSLTVAYNGDPALDGVTFEVQAGERIAIIGPNGAGKSTLIQTLLGLLQPKSGTVTLHDIRREQIGYVPQHEGVSWDFPVTVGDVVMMGRARQIGWLRWPNKRQWSAVDNALARVGMLDLRDRQVGELSGGQRRRVFIARALAQEAAMLILDEPFSGVDVQAQSELMEVLDGLNRDGMTILLSTHDLDLAFRRFDRVLALRKQMIAYGTPQAVYKPEILSQMYGTRITLSENGGQFSLFVDDHGCHEC
jgi:ABC-type Mn2+/Zn2+ transport system ATPase subunit